VFVDEKGSARGIFIDILQEVARLDDRTYIRRDDAGHITHFEGIVLDITDSVAATEALRQNKEELLRSKNWSPLAFLPEGLRMT
jgi:hypothetical protein